MHVAHRDAASVSTVATVGSIPAKLSAPPVFHHPISIGIAHVGSLGEFLRTSREPKYSLYQSGPRGSLIEAVDNQLAEGAMSGVVGACVTIVLAVSVVSGAASVCGLG